MVARADWYEAIDGSHLSEVEQNGIEFFKNYNRAIHQRAAADIDRLTQGVAFDLPQFQADLVELGRSSASDAVLAGVSIADDLLKDMFRRERRERLEVDALLAPLGPLGDFNKRLKVAALADFIDDDVLTFFDQLRRVRNRIAHARRPHPPSRDDVQNLLRASPAWLEAIEADERLELLDIDRGSPSVLIAAICAHLSVLAWQSILRPVANRANVPIKMLVERQARIFTSTSAAGMGIALDVLGAKRR